MLDIPMLQTTPKAERSDTSPSKATNNHRDEESSEVDFDTEYANEAEDRTRDSKEPNAEPMNKAQPDRKDTPEESTALESTDATEPATDQEILSADEEEAGEPDVGLLGKPSQNDVERREAVAKPSTGTSEWLFSQRIASEIVSEVAEEPETPKLAAEVTADLGKTPAVDKGLLPTAPVTSKKIQATGPVAVSLSDSEVAVPQNNRGADAASLTAAQMANASAQTQGQQSPTAMIVPTATVERPTIRETRKNAEEVAISNSDASPRIETKAPPPPSTSSASSSAATAQPLTQLTAQQDVAGLDVPLSVSGEAEAPTMWDARSAPPTSTALAQTLTRPETPGMIGRQLAEVLQRMPDRPVEVALNPEELGKVRLSISAAEGGITVSVLAERPETLDLMRRHIDQLAREFQALGYDSINFAFNEGQSEQNDSQTEGEFAGSDSKQTADVSPTETAAPVQLTASTGVDLRL